MLYIFLGIAAILLPVIIILNRKITKSRTGSNSFLEEEAEEIVSKLEAFGFYKYADPEDISGLKNDLQESLNKHGMLSTIVSEKTLTPKDYRLYHLDGESLFEQGGFTDMLEYMKPTFSKMRLQIEVSDHFEDYDTDKKWLNHLITINNKQYIIFKEFTGYGWGEAAQRFAYILNDQLKLQGIDERLYLLSGGNEGECIFLSDAQFQLLDSVLKDERAKPLRTEDW